MEAMYQVPRDNAACVPGGNLERVFIILSNYVPCPNHTLRRLRMPRTKEWKNRVFFVGAVTVDVGRKILNYSLFRVSRYDVRSLHGFDNNLCFLCGVAAEPWCFARLRFPFLFRKRLFFSTIKRDRVVRIPFPRRALNGIITLYKHECLFLLIHFWILFSPFFVQNLN